MPPGLALPTLDDVLRWAAAALDAHFVTLVGQPQEALSALVALQVLPSLELSNIFSSPIQGGPPLTLNLNRKCGSLPTTKKLSKR